MSIPLNDKITIGEIVDAYLAWGRSEGKYKLTSIIATAPISRPKFMLSCR